VEITNFVIAAVPSLTQRIGDILEAFGEDILVNEYFFWERGRPS
jgi:hypothetical protein